MAKKQLQLFKVRNLQGQFLGSYRVYTAEQAIQKLIDEQQLMASTFRKSHSRINLDRNQFVAKVEG